MSILTSLFRLSGVMSRYYKHTEYKQLAQEVILLTCIQEFTGSNLRRDNGYPEYFLLNFPQSLQTNLGIVLQVLPRPFLSAYLIIKA
jgi:hypothetical protein